MECQEASQEKENKLYARIMARWETLQVSPKIIFMGNRWSQWEKNGKDTSVVARDNDVYIAYDDNSINLVCQDSTRIIDSNV